LGLERGGSPPGLDQGRVPLNARRFALRRSLLPLTERRMFALRGSLRSLLPLTESRMFALRGSLRSLLPLTETPSAVPPPGVGGSGMMNRCCMQLSPRVAVEPGCGRCRAPRIPNSSSR
jgi:hypothetical protein